MSWSPPNRVSKAQVVAESQALLGTAPQTIRESEDVFPITSVGLDWDIGVRVYEPELVFEDQGKPVGIFLLHGGSQDFRSMEPFARLIASRLGYKVVSMTFPGRLYLPNPDRIWPGDTVRPDGSVRTPIWLAGETIGKDQYEVIQDVSKRERYGTRVLARALPGTKFFDRLASWPVAFEEAMIQSCQRHFDDSYSVLVHGHSTGGPFVSALSQRVPNVGGVLAIENSPFGYIQEQARLYTGNMERAAKDLPAQTIEDVRWTSRFDDLSIRTWREEARYAGPQAAMLEGTNALMRLPSLMEDVLASWEEAKIQASFKCEYLVTRNIRSSLEAAASATSARLGLDSADTGALIARYVGLTGELHGSGVKPVPPTLFGITKASRDHPPEVYRDVILPMYEQMEPAPKMALTQFEAGVHEYTKAEPDLPMGVAPSVITGWHQAVINGFFG